MLLSAFSDGTHIIPVEFNIKEYKTPKTPNKLYVTITLGKIKIEDNVMVQTADRNQRNNTRLPSIINLPQLISKINPEYGNFYKYIPKALLNEEQIKSKEIAEADVKHSLDWIDFAEETARERSLVSEITELKKINEELRGKIQHPGVKHILSKVGVQRCGGSKLKNFDKSASNGAFIYFYPFTIAHLILL